LSPRYGYVAQLFSSKDDFGKGRYPTARKHHQYERYPFPASVEVLTFCESYAARAAFRLSRQRYPATIIFKECYFCTSKTRYYMALGGLVWVRFVATKRLFQWDEAPTVPFRPLWLIAQLPDVLMPYGTGNAGTVVGA
jgi:hypothetical protein